MATNTGDTTFNLHSFIHSSYTNDQFRAIGGAGVNLSSTLVKGHISSSHTQLSVSIQTFFMQCALLATVWPNLNLDFFDFPEENDFPGETLSLFSYIFSLDLKESQFQSRHVLTQLFQTWNYVLELSYNQTIQFQF